MKEQPRTYVTHFQHGNFKHKIKRLQIALKLLDEKFYLHEKILSTQNCRRKFMKNLLLENNATHRKHVNQATAIYIATE